MEAIGMTFYDITLPMDATLAAWPGDTPFAFRLTWKRSEGASVNLGTMTMSAHAGTHADAPFHYADGGATIEAIDPGVYIGPARVVDVSGKPLIRVEDLQAFDLRPTPRLLLRTNAWTDAARFPETIPVIAPDVPAYLGAQGVLLLGLDAPSVDAIDSESLPNHHALGSCGIHILESLRLADVPEGVYELIALPLRLVGGDGSPVRALLRPLTT